jgi:hypothetical protein
MWIIRVEDLSSQRDRLLSDFLDDCGSVSKNYLKMGVTYRSTGPGWTSTEDIVAAKVWSTEKDANRFLDSVNNVKLKWRNPTYKFFIDKKLTIEELSYQEWNDLIDINNW